MRQPLASRIRGVARSVASALVVVVFGAAEAHEPLWGETPTIFGPHVYHAEVGVAWVTKGPKAQRMRAFGQEFGLQYGVNRWVNVRIHVPFSRTELESTTPLGRSQTSVSGVGDIALAAKYRYWLRQEEGRQASQSLILGWKMPTGADDRIGPGGERLLPSEQPGTGNHGLELAWSFDRETAKDTIWASAGWRRDLGSGFRSGDHAELDAAYGRWLVRPNLASDLGLTLAAGVNAVFAGEDRLGSGTSADNDYRLVGLHITPIITKGRAQYRVGVLVPLARGGDEAETDFDFEFRAAWEMFF